jgi:hypothetical protein
MLQVRQAIAAGSACAIDFAVVSLVRLWFSQLRQVRQFWQVQLILRFLVLFVCF